MHLLLLTILNLKELNFNFKYFFIFLIFFKNKKVLLFQKVNIYSKI